MMSPLHHSLRPFSDIFSPPARSLQCESLLESRKKASTVLVDYTKPTETVRALDWDDTLFPTTFLRQELARMGYKWNSFPDDHMSMKVGKAAEINMRRCDTLAAELIRAASDSGHVVILTLARRPWIEVLCKMFYPTVAGLIDSLEIPIVYARDSAQVQIRYWADDDVDYLNMKRDALSTALDAFYSQYEGQTWKNVISIGDSEYERLGTQLCTEAYIQRQFASGRIVKVRTKTFKLPETPNTTELTNKLKILINILPGTVRLDGNIDVDLAMTSEDILMSRLSTTSFAI
jgi:hypothetical protein